jgi:hypothetical protein
MNFQELYNTLPQILKDKLEDLKLYKENPQDDIEDNCYIHVQTVTERCMRTTIPELICCGILHDICKKDSSRVNPKSGYNMSPGHEEYACRLIDKHEEIKDWVTNIMKADLDMVIYLVQNHMRIKQMQQMRQHKQNEMTSHPWFKYLVVFNGFDNMVCDEEQIDYFVNAGLKL